MNNDARVNKRTLVVYLGERYTLAFYLLLGVGALLLLFTLCYHLPTSFSNVWVQYLPAFVPLIFLPLHLHTWQELKRIRHGRALNALFGRHLPQHSPLCPQLLRGSTSAILLAVIQSLWQTHNYSHAHHRSSMPTTDNAAARR